MRILQRAHDERDGWRSLFAVPLMPSRLGSGILPVAKN